MAPTALGGRWALALLNALLVGLLAHLGYRAAGGWGRLAPLLVYAGSLEFLTRAVRLRPELLALTLLLAAIWAAGAGRHRLVGLLSALFTLSYTAFQALFGLLLLCFLQRGWQRRRWEWALPLYAALGTGLGLLLHPHFPDNLVVWKVQNIDFFRLRAELDVGQEIRPQTTDQIILLNLAWAIALVALWRSDGRRRDAPGPRDEATADFLWVATLAFGALYLLMLRFGLYFVPLATLAVLCELRRRRGPGGSIALPPLGRLPTALVLAPVVAVGAWRSADLLAALAKEGGPIAREAEWAAFGRAVPAGARVAAEWGSTHLYIFWAPQATYLNVLDPIFMAVPFPEAYRAQRRLFLGEEPDVPLVLHEALDSRFLAISRFHRHPQLLRRLPDDPRLRPLHSGYTLLYEAVPGANGDFVLDWRLPPPAARFPPAPSVDTASWIAYPRLEGPEDRALEGFVDGARLGGDPRCFEAVHTVTAGQTEAASFELAPWGPTTTWIDGREVVDLRASPAAVLGEGVILEGVGASRRIAIRTCPAGRSGRTGFYLVRRDPAAPAER